MQLLSEYSDLENFETHQVLDTFKTAQMPKVLLNTNLKYFVT